MKKRLFFDMDNVLVDFQSVLDRVDEETKNKYRAKNPGEKDRLDEIPGLFGKMDPMPGAIEAVHKLVEDYDVFILSTAPWNNPSAWSDKVTWVTKYFDDVFHKRMIITHRKDLVEGDYLIDDRGKNGTSECKGEWIQFGSERFPNWDTVVDYLLNPLRTHPLKLHIHYLTNPYKSGSGLSYPKEPKYAGGQIYTMMLTEGELETVRMEMFGAKKTASTWTFHERMKTEIKRVLDNSLGMDCDTKWIEYEWASGEKERLTADIRYIDLKDVILMKSRISEKAENISRKELLLGLESCCIRQVEWASESGYRGMVYLLLDVPDNYDYFDMHYTYPIRLSKFSTETIVQMLNKYII